MNELDLHNIDLSSRDKLFAIQALMENRKDLFECPVNHYFVPGVYIRELFVPKGVMLVGKIHKYKQFHIIMKGTLEVLIDDKIETIIGPNIIVSPAGAKRIARAIEDTTWLMVHGTNEIDLDKIENHFTANTEQEFVDFINEQKKLPLFEYDDR